MYGNVINKDAVVVVPSDVTLLARGVCNGIYVGGAGGTVTVLTEGGSTVTFTAPVIGQVIPIRAARVNATGTASTLLLALY